jgi:hypothetical protein
MISKFKGRKISARILMHTISVPLVLGWFHSFFLLILLAPHVRTSHVVTETADTCEVLDNRSILRLVSMNVAGLPATIGCRSVQPAGRVSCRGKALTPLACKIARRLMGQ